MRKRLRVCAVFVLAIAGIALFLYFMPGRTPAIRTAHGVASLERVRIGGVDQWILVRGNDTSLPVLLFLHGGPGMPSTYLAHAFQPELEKEFVVVEWDQRGAGKSYRSGLAGSLTTEQLIADTVEMTNLLRTRFRQNKIYLAGHSWGTYLGMLVVARHPELYRGYVGIGQLARFAPIHGIQDEYIRQSALKAGDLQAIRALDRGAAGAREKLLFRFGGELRNARSFLPLLIAGLKAPEYSLRDALDIPKGVSLYSTTRFAAS